MTLTFSRYPKSIRINCDYEKVSAEVMELKTKIIQNQNRLKILNQGIDGCERFEFDLTNSMSDKSESRSERMDLEFEKADLMQEIENNEKRISYLFNLYPALKMHMERKNNSSMDRN